GRGEPTRSGGCRIGWPGEVVFLEHDLSRPASARRSIKPNDEPRKGLRAGGKPVPTFRDHALGTEQISLAGVPQQPAAARPAHRLEVRLGAAPPRPPASRSGGEIPGPERPRAYPP